MAKKTAPTTRGSAAAEARAKAQAQMRAQERRTQVTIIVSVVAGLALFGGLAWFIMSQSQTPGLGDADARVPAASTERGGFPVGTTGVVGQDVPTGAVEVSIYADFMCPACAAFEFEVGPELDQMREEGLIELSYHPISILDRGSPTQYSTRAANAAATVADGAPEHFLEFQELLFENQPRQGQNHWNDRELADFARQAGVPDDVASTIPDGLDRAWVQVATEQASVDGMQGTPTVIVNGTVVNQMQVPYFEPGVLRAYIEDAADS